MASTQRAQNFDDQESKSKIEGLLQRNRRYQMKFRRGLGLHPAAQSQMESHALQCEWSTFASDCFLSEKNTFWISCV